MTTVDIEAIRRRHLQMIQLVVMLAERPGPATAANAHSAALACAADVLPVLAELEEARRELGRLRAELHDARFGMPKISTEGEGPGSTSPEPGPPSHAECEHYLGTGTDCREGEYTRRCVPECLPNDHRCAPAESTKDGAAC